MVIVIKYEISTAYNRRNSCGIPFTFRTKIMARNPESSDCDVQSTLFQLLRHPELSIDLGLSACRYLNASNRFYDYFKYLTYEFTWFYNWINLINRFLLCERGLNELLVRYTGSSNLARIYVGKLESALHRLPDDEALPYVQTFVKGMWRKVQIGFNKSNHNTWRATTYFQNISL